MSIFFLLSTVDSCEISNACFIKDGEQKKRNNEVDGWVPTGGLIFNLRIERK